MYNCRIVADSIAENGCRLTTFEVTFPRMILAEWNTHRVFSRNTASSRAIPVERLMKAIKEAPFIPERFPKNKAGMSSNEWLEGDDHIAAEAQWLYARDQALKFAQNLETLKVHKQVANRLLEPFMWVTSVTSSTEWNNFFTLRVNKDLADTVETWEDYKRFEDENARNGNPFPAQPEIQHVAFEMRKSYTQSVPKLLKEGEWHLPYVSVHTERALVGSLLDLTKPILSPEEFEKRHIDLCIKTSMGRCARVSYLNHGENNTPEKDIEICEKLIASRHMSPTEHAATPAQNPTFYGNFKGWTQYRKSIQGESGE